eukprot:8338132-Prorocentrum_lima.AAC.1
MCPAQIREHLEIHTGTLDSYEKQKLEVERILEKKLGGDPMGAAPMDVGALTKGDKKGQPKGCPFLSPL